MAYTVFKCIRKTWVADLLHNIKQNFITLVKIEVFLVIQYSCQLGELMPLSILYHISKRSECLCFNSTIMTAQF